MFEKITKTELIASAYAMLSYDFFNNEEAFYREESGFPSDMGFNVFAIKPYGFDVDRFKISSRPIEQSPNIGIITFSYKDGTREQLKSIYKIYADILKKHYLKCAEENPILGWRIYEKHFNEYADYEPHFILYTLNQEPDIENHFKVENGTLTLVMRIVLTDFKFSENIIK